LARQIRHSRFQSDADDLKREIIQIIFSQIQKNTVRRKPSEHGQVAQPVQQLSTAVAAALEAAHSAFAATLSSAINPPREASAGIATGFRELDQYLGGLRQGDMLVIAGPAGIGKTALARGIALNVAQTLLDETKPDHIGPPCAYFTMQETAEDQATRILTALCEISEERIRRGMIEEADFARLVTASQRMANMPLYFDQAKDLSFSQLCTNVQRLAERHKGISLAVIDSLEALLRPPGNGWSEIAFALKGLAANLASPLIVVVRTTASQQFSQKGLEALGEFRDIGLAADKVLFLQGAGYSLLAERPPADNEEAYSAWLRDWEATRGLSEIFVSKNAGGKTGTVAIRFDGAINRYQDL
jgi:replicative DNA helicase